MRGLEAGQSGKVFSNCLSKFRRSSSPLAALLFIATVGLLVRIGHWNLSPYSDECKYLSHALYLFRGVEPAWFDPAVAARIWYLLVLGSWAQLVGFSTFAMQSLSLVWFLVNVILIFLICRRLHGESAALCAATLYAFLPIDVRHSTAAATDQPGVMLALLGFTLYLAGNSSILGKFFQAGAIGLLSVVSVGVRQTLILFYAPFVLDLILRRESYVSKASTIAALVSGALLAMMAQSYVLWRWLGDPGFSLRTNVEIMSEIEKAASVFAGIGYLKEAVNSWGDFGTVGMLILVLLPNTFRQPKRPLIVLAISAGLYTLYHIGGTVSLKHWAVPWVSPRYLMPAIAAGSILISQPLYEVMKGLPTASRAIAVTILVASSLLALRTRERPGVSELAWALPTLASDLGEFYFPASAIKYFLPFDRQELPRSAILVSDSELINKVAPKATKVVIIPEAPYYRYKHVGVLDAFAERPEIWEMKPIKVAGWPPYRYLLTGHKDRVVGWLFKPRISGGIRAWQESGHHDSRKVGSE